MSPYIETIRIQDGECKNLPYHQARFERTRHLELGLKSHPDLNQLVKKEKHASKGLMKCRISYGAKIEAIQFEPYSRRVVNSLKILQADHIKYAFKYSNRAELEKLYKQRGLNDDILIVKDGCVTDSYLANAAFWNGEEWFTPDTPLLAGTMREFLLERKALKLARITPGNLNQFKTVKLINALNNLEEGSEIPMERVSFQ